MSNMWTEASRDIEGERARMTGASARVAVSDLTGFLFQATTERSFADRMALLGDRLSERLASVTANPSVHTQIREGLHADWLAVLASRKTARTRSLTCGSCGHTWESRAQYRIKCSQCGAEESIRESSRKTAAGIEHLKEGDPVYVYAVEPPYDCTVVKPLHRNGWGDEVITVSGPNGEPPRDVNPIIAVTEEAFNSGWHVYDGDKIVAGGGHITKERAEEIAREDGRGVVRQGAKTAAEIDGHFCLTSADPTTGITTATCVCGWSESAPTKSGAEAKGDAHEAENGGWAYASRKAGALSWNSPGGNTLVSGGAEVGFRITGTDASGNVSLTATRDGDFLTLNDFETEFETVAQAKAEAEKIAASHKEGSRKTASGWDGGIFDRFSESGDFLGWGYIGERSRALDQSDPESDMSALVPDVDESILERVQDEGWTEDELFTWANSKDGRWFADVALGSDDLRGAMQYLRKQSHREASRQAALSKTGSRKMAYGDIGVGNEVIWSGPGVPDFNDEVLMKAPGANGKPYVITEIESLRDYSLGKYPNGGAVDGDMYSLAEKWHEENAFTGLSSDVEDLPLAHIERGGAKAVVPLGALVRSSVEVGSGQRTLPFSASRRTATRYCTDHDVFVGDGNASTHVDCKVETRKKKEAGLDGFWEEISAQIAALGTAKSAAEVIRILGGAEGASSGDAFFAGSGGDDSVYEALMDAGWSLNWAEANYHWAATAPDGSQITYVEGDVYVGDQGKHEGSRRQAAERVYPDMTANEYREWAESMGPSTFQQSLNAALGWEDMDPNARRMVMIVARERGLIPPLSHTTSRKTAGSEQDG